jgi:hypothetical protein
MNATLFSRHNLSRSDISVRYVFQKMFSPKGTLVAVECLSRFDRLSISPENFFRYANTGLRESIFMEQLALLKNINSGLSKMLSRRRLMLMTIYLTYCNARRLKRSSTKSAASILK